MNFPTIVTPNQSAPSRFLPAAQMAMMIMEESGASEDPRLLDRDDLFIQYIFDANIQMRVLAASDGLQYAETVVEGCQAPKPRNSFSLHRVYEKHTGRIPLWVGSDYHYAGRHFGQRNRRNCDGMFLLNDAGPFHVSTSDNLNGRTLCWEFRGAMVDAQGFPYADYFYKQAYMAFAEWRLAMRDGASMDMRRALKQVFHVEHRNCQGLSAGADITKDQMDQLVARMKNPWDMGNNRYKAADSVINNNPLSNQGYGWGGYGPWAYTGMRGGWGFGW